MSVSMVPPTSAPKGGTITSSVPIVAPSSILNSVLPTKWPRNWLSALAFRSRVTCSNSMGSVLPVKFLRMAVNRWAMIQPGGVTVNHHLAIQTARPTNRGQYKLPGEVG